MKKNGFTLVELLGAIAVLSLLVVIIAPVVTNLIGDNEDILYDEQVNSLISATKKYMVLNSELLPEGKSSFFVKIEDLIDSGVIDNDDVIDPKTRSSLTGCVKVKYNSDFNQYDYIYIEYCELGDGQWDFEYNGSFQQFVVPVSGNYVLEVWGASGGNMPNSFSSYYGGNGGYSVGTVFLEKDTKLYIYVGGKGISSCTSSCDGGFNGGGNGVGNASYPVYSSSGGGASHIALSNGLLSSLSGNEESILIVAGGGGGTSYQSASYTGIGGSGGGFIGNSGTYSSSSYKSGAGGSQILGGSAGKNSRGNSGSFGKGGDGINYSGGGGGGFYGGGASNQAGGGGGSGYIGNSRISDGAMYCYACTESTEPSTKTISTTDVSTDAVSRSAKKGNGAARITFYSK